MKIFYWLNNFLKNYFVVIFLIILFLASNYALFKSGFFPLHDFTHAARIAEMGRALSDGQFPVRWSENFGYGFGMPLFNFYAPLPYFLGALLWLNGLEIVAAIKFLYLFSSALTIFGAFLLGKKLAGRSAGILLATVLTLSPYRAVNLFVRGAMSEAFAMSFFPLVIWAIISFAHERKSKFLLILILSLSSIVLSHNLSALMFYPIAALFSFGYFLWQYKFKLSKTIKNLLPIVLTFILSITLTAFYSLPAILEKDQTIIDTIFSGYFHYSNHFLYIRQFFSENWGYDGSGWGPDDGMSFFLGYGQVATLLVLMLFFLKKIFNLLKANKLGEYLKLKSSYILFFSQTLILLSLFMSLLKSKFLWDNFSILPIIQFPWRFLSIAILFTALLSTYIPKLITNKWLKYISITFILAISFINLKFFRPNYYLDSSQSLYYSDPVRIKKEMSGILPDYIPKQMAGLYTLSSSALNDQKMLWLNLDNTEDFYETIIDKNHEKLFLIEVPNEELINFRVAYFSGWKAELNGHTTDIIVNPELGNIQVKVPAGQSLLGISFTENTTARLIGDVLSFFSLIALLLFLNPFISSQKNKKIS